MIQYFIGLLFSTIYLTEAANFILNPLQLTSLQLPVHSQYHAQDELGQYSYGYTSPLSSKNEIRTADGVTRGAYSFMDANGLLQNVQYTADAVNGFRVVGSNIPKLISNLPASNLAFPIVTPDNGGLETNEIENPSVPKLKINNNLLSPLQSLHFQPKISLLYPNLAYNSLILPSTSSQYHNQNGLGAYSYGYSNQFGSKSEVKDLDGTTRGSYAYIDPNGIVQTVRYVADATNGFRVEASNAPQMVTESNQLTQPTETPEVKQAKLALQLAHDEAKRRLAGTRMERK